jgi:16S rRNA (guanine527-N7)-methyltransferase
MSLDARLLSRGLAALGLEPEGALADTLLRYLEEIERQNPALGLVGASGDELIIKHALDSLAPIEFLRGLASEISATRAGGVGDRAVAPLRPRIADLGSGAGLPGIPLALAMPELEVHLIDRMTRRTDFLRSVVELLKLDNVQVLENQVEHIRGSWDLVVFRAFRPFERKLFKRVFALCASDGYVAAYKGKIDKARSELAALDGLYADCRIEPVTVPFLSDERCLVIMSPRS